MKKLSVLILLFFACTVYGATLEIPAPSGRGTYAELDAEAQEFLGPITFDESTTAPGYIMENLTSHPTTGEGYYKLYTKDGVPYFLSDSYFFALSEEIYLHSQLISELSLYPFKPLRKVGGFDLGYSLYFDSASCTNAIKEVESASVMRVQDDGTITNGNLIMFGSSVATDTPLDLADAASGSYMSNANTTFNWNGTGEDTGQLMAAGYLRQALTRSGATLQSNLELALTSATYIDVIVKMNTTHTTPENNIGVFFKDNADVRYTYTGTMLKHDVSTVYVDYVAWYGIVTGTARADAPMNKRLQVFNDAVNDEGNYILSNLVAGVPTVEYQYVNQVGTQVLVNPYYCGPILTLNPTNYPNPEIAITASVNTDGTTNADVYGIYIYWEN